MERSGERKPDKTPSDELERLRQENETLSGQIKRLIRTESKLYAYQEELDVQLREYKGLYELNRRLIETFDLGKLYEYACEYVINGLEYERVLIFQLDRERNVYTVSASDGYYDQEEKEGLSAILIQRDDPVLSFLGSGKDYLLCPAESSGEELQRYRGLLGMNEYLIFPLISHGVRFALLVVGNTAANAGFYRRIVKNGGEPLGVGNLVGLLSASIENHILYTDLSFALGQARDAEAKYRSIFENAVEGIYQTSAEGRFISCNPATAAILGYDSPEELIDRITNIEEQLYVDPTRRGVLMELMRDRREVKNFEVEFYRKDGKKQWTLLSVHPTLDEKGEIIRIDGIMLDIAERKRVEELIRNSLKEKETLLREIHHRVKNNLQIITTLLDLQSMSIADTQSRRFFNECQDRIRSIALIHEKLYETTDVVSIDFSEYLDSLVRHIFAMYIPDNRVSLNLSVEEIPMGIDDAIPCGLVVNELVTNALKYAFPLGGNGELEVRLAIDDDDTVTLRVADNGVGLPPDLDFRKTETLGLQLVNLLVKQLNGTIVLTSGPGAAFDITFRRRPYSKVSISR